MAAYTTAGLAAMRAAIVSAQPGSPAAQPGRTTRGGALTRSLLQANVRILPALRWLSPQGERASLDDHSVGAREVR